MALGAEFMILVLSIILLVYYISKYAFKYWQRCGIPFIPPTFLIGNMKEILLLEESPADIMRNFYNHVVARAQPVFGIFLFYTPALIIRDLNLIKRILIKDFNHFANRFSTVDPHADILGYYNMFFVKNPEWKEVRTSITPVFTSGKLKQMFGLVSEIGNQLDAHLCSLKPDPKTNQLSLEMKEMCALYTTDVIASVAYGIQANSLKNPNGEFRSNGRKIFGFTRWKSFNVNLIFFNPVVAKMIRSRFFSDENEKFLKSAIYSALDIREKTGITRNDLIDILLSLKKSPIKDDPKLMGDILVAQAAVFFTAGYETASSTMSFSLYELCKDMECQNRLREEIRKVLKENNGQLTYDAVLNMEYLNMVIMEVLRLYPPLPFLDRECTSRNGYSLEPEVNFTVPNGMPVYIPVYGIHRDPEYFPDPDKFDPERFSAANKDKIVPYSYMPFGAGPHNCIGERFGLIQAKVGLINVLRNHFVKPTSKTSLKLKLGRALIIQAEGGIPCELVKDPLE
ncbi:unnamed protein product [Hermetia illucens]|uniref:Cytochrome P450 n=1 Tax=Hermetia illucens TaxID=343691 RepID=A0A7R8UVK4_HERIL|nr:probable cytochrome P450 6g2 [Hermetia illucens]XP_037916288.1 probable cytochrome P450 6g2 [Hermetia illucens]XP_037916289.1 probable cytochrome P450 6g2 [Hermetia illucens]CAD7086708.1 unnamed protein product [Hermetia illucens]